MECVAGVWALMSGKLDDRVQLLRQRCIGALGEELFLTVYAHIHKVQEEEEQLDEYAMEAELQKLVAPGLIGYVKEVEQLIFIEQCYV